MLEALCSALDRKLTMPHDPMGHPMPHLEPDAELWPKDGSLPKWILPSIGGEVGEEALVYDNLPSRFDFRLGEQHFLHEIGSKPYLGPRNEPLPGPPPMEPWMRKGATPKGKGDADGAEKEEDLLPKDTRVPEWNEWTVGA